VKENIAAFDGDPNDVTLVGHGHGAALVNLLMLSPVTKGNKADQRVGHWFDLSLWRRQLWATGARTPRLPTISFLVTRLI